MSLNLDYFKNLDSVPGETNERKKLNTLLLGDTITGLGFRKFVYKTLNKTRNEFIVYVKNDQDTWDEGKLLYCHLTNNTSDVIIKGKKQTVNNDTILTKKRYDDYNKQDESEAVTPRTRKNDPLAEKIIPRETVDTEAVTPQANIQHPDTDSIFLENDALNEEIGGRKKRTRKQKQKPSRKGKKTKKSRFSAKKSRRNRKNKRKGKTNSRNN
jgi:hypothetical protein